MCVSCDSIRVVGMIAVAVAVDVDVAFGRGGCMYPPCFREKVGMVDVLLCR